MSILDSLMGSLGGGAIDQISKQLGADKKTTEKAIGAALPTLLGAIAKNSSKPEGANALHKALEKDHDGSALDNLSGLVGGQFNKTGDGILGHVLGNRRGMVEKGLSQVSGLDNDKTSKLMSMLAPAVMGQLGKQQRSGGLNPEALMGMLSKERDSIQQKEPKMMGLAGKLLDADGDGDVDVSDFVKQGGGVLGKLFGK